MAPQLAWLGLGNMGRGMAKNLAAKGTPSLPLIIYNRSVTRAQDFQAANPNTVVAPTISEAVTKSDIIFTCVGDDAAIQSIIDASIASGSLQNKLFVDLSTVHPDTTTSISTKLQSHGASFVASPVFGAPPMAAAGLVIPVLAGPRSAVDQVKPYTTGVIAKSIVDFSDQPPAKASQLKILGNTFVLGMVESIAEGLVVADKCSLGTDALHQFFEAVFPGPYVAYSARMRSGDYHERAEPLFAVDLARKDARHALDLAAKSGATMKGVELADAYMAKVKEHMGTRGDVAGMYGAVRQEAGLEFENKQ
ncbi:6-phosphogluconate dehydrogenase-like protein NAD-binding protein [Aspergillus sclerotiicarbonarius CBS 121057]|uniref:6-phosphogluconate dehydrogenase-like protein NAD-binding protein n=1 Tax=Aspergillus sclerotiicarbonarius (strain CBS 121057 / IBT 28362) TaxID=1448318 RepID=A0A319DYA0_ASPSB|nr:6-phosphogluconate dehydrogenase-like protein NAD-binding protein [Aspergillus sclerotiicarbonarius CBS 121057]